ncbi:Holliday junction resolvase RecU [Enterococcus dongliensis]|uniref:Holliday junction resolvase RecU n=1 Tax=Enterococcus dongliensis TaxID=2559925 RepID=UPI00288F9103|nr:Holliday junction resolvase RecU [Enterococcus dongliensis]MDT2604949.1 Holliday junction resolvase RecU [Enterococcus dongliensis]MDT2645609.1 Holliday junction resolvase RecU [Enterococcus dongliensis]MDT2676607.1 Holliday junction resolvase RecU [Enterococcus dongliensis]MDT2710749.1 Holliday junction resolvase RecU [Enterococcus dongliensis]
MKPWSQFEKHIESVNQFYRVKKFGVVEKIPNGTKTIRQGGRQIIVRDTKTGCDFIGHLDGTPIAFDCKLTANKTNFPFGSGKVVTVKPHQKAFLKDFKKDGACAFLLVALENARRVFLVDIDDYLNIEQEMLAIKRKSIPIARLERYEVDQATGIIDYRRNILEDLK